MARNRFQNPADGESYYWHQNHDPEGEEETGKTRAVERVPNTSGTGVVLTQGDDGSYTLKFRGKILKRAQLQAFWHWYKLSGTQSIYFTDFDAQQYEVQITSFTPKRRGKLSSTRQDATTPNHYWEYSIEMTVLRFIAGDMADAGVTP